MTSLRFGLNRHFKTKGTDIIQDQEFAEANKVFLAKCVDLKQQGLAKVEHKPAILEKQPSKTVRVEFLTWVIPEPFKTKFSLRLRCTFAAVEGKTSGS